MNERIPLVVSSSTQQQQQLVAFKGETKQSIALDVFICIHAVVAFLFASLMLFYPQTFFLLIKKRALSNTGVDYAPLLMDSIRWASPFVYGFSVLAASSLDMTPDDRRKVARIYVMSFGLAVCVGIYVQSTGRWNEFHPISISLFAMLAVTYAFFLLQNKGSSFHRGVGNSTTSSRRKN